MNGMADFFRKLSKIVQDNIHYAKAIKLMGFHTNAAKIDFSEVGNVGSG